MKQKLVRLTVEITPEEKKKLKILAAKQGKTLKSWVLAKIRQDLGSA